MNQTLAAQAVSRFLRLDPAAAATLAARAMAAHADIKRPLRRQASWWRRPDREVRPALPPQADGPVVLALAFSQGPLLWLQQHSLVGARPLRILRTDLSEAHFREHARYHGPLELLTPLEMIRHRFDPGVGTVFVTFPDHTVGNGNINVQAPLFGEPMLFQTLESLLVRKHDAGLYRLDGGCLERWVSGSALAGGSEHCLIAEAGWLAASIERTIISMPEEYFGWHRIARKCPHRMQGMHRVRLDVLRGFLRSWAWRAQAHAEGLHEILALIDRDGPELVEAETNAGLRLAAGSQWP